MGTLGVLVRFKEVVIFILVGCSLALKRRSLCVCTLEYLRKPGGL